MKRIIMCDIDDTCIDLVAPWLESYNEKYNDSVKKSDILTWNITDYTKKCTPQEFFDLLTPKLYGTLKPLEGAVDGLKELSQDSIIIFCSSTSKHMTQAKMDLIDRCFPFIGSNNLLPIYSRDILKANIVKGTAIIDDRYDNILGFDGVKMLFKQPWNANVVHRESVDYNMRTCDWSIIPDWIYHYETNWR